MNKIILGLIIFSIVTMLIIYWKYFIKPRIKEEGNFDTNDTYERAKRKGDANWQ